MPRLQALRNQFGTDELEIVAINRHDSHDQVEQFVRSSQITFRVALEGEASGVAARYDVRCYPATFVLDREAQVAAVIVGHNEERLRQALEAVRQPGAADQA